MCEVDQLRRAPSRPAPAEISSHRCTSSPSRESASGWRSGTTRTADCCLLVAPRGIVPPRLLRVCQNLAAADAPAQSERRTYARPTVRRRTSRWRRSASEIAILAPAATSSDPPERCAIGGQPHAQPAARVDIIAGVIASLVHDLVDPYGVCARWRHAGTADVDVIDPGDTSGVVHIMILSPAPR